MQTKEDFAIQELNAIKSDLIETFHLPARFYYA